MERKTITVNIAREGEREVQVKWKGNALALHRPQRNGGDSKLRKFWAITHIESGLLAGTYDGPYTEALKLTKAWDETFAEDLPGATPDARNWSLKDRWSAQLNQREPIISPKSFDFIIQEYAQ